MVENLRPAYLAALKGRCEINDKGCWLWTGAVDKDGYGETTAIKVDGKQVHRVHRVTFWLANGWLPRLLDHRICDTPRCCNPAHVEPSDDKRNTLRGKGPTAINARKTRCPKGHVYSGMKKQQGGWVRICKVCRRDQRKAAYYRKRGR